MTTDAPSSDAARYPLAWLWPVGLGALLCGSIGVCVVTAIVAAGDPSVALEPDYYERAVAWDEAAAARDASRALGWTVTAEVSSPIEASSARHLTLRLTDALGAPVLAERVEVVAFHHARRREAVTLSAGTGAAAPAGRGALLSAGDGSWTWSLGPARAGVWQVRVRAIRGADAFTKTLDLETADGAG